MRWLRHPIFVLTLVACGGMLLALAVLPDWTQRRLAQGLHRKIAEGEERDALTLIPKLALLGDRALPHLVTLLDDPRQRVRIATREALSGLLDQWESQPGPASDAGAIALAAALAEHDPPRDIYSQVFVRVTVLKLLRQPLESRVDKSRFLADCTAVLERTSGSRVAELERVAVASEPLTQPAAAASDLAPAAEIEDDVQEPAPIAEPEPELLPRQSLPPLELQPGSARLPQPSATNPIDPAALQGLATRSLIRHLHGISEVAQAAEKELRRRGFRDNTLRVARALDDPDRQVRLRLVESLPHLGGIDAAAWLWELAEDEDPAVREAARSILSTSTNPLTRRRLGQWR